MIAKQRIVARPENVVHVEKQIEHAEHDHRGCKGSHKPPARVEGEGPKGQGGGGEVSGKRVPAVEAASAHDCDVVKKAQAAGDGSEDKDAVDGIWPRCGGIA